MRNPLHLAGFDSVHYVVQQPYRRIPLFGWMRAGELVMNAIGQIALECWVALPETCPGVTLDALHLLPDSLLGIVILTKPDDAPAPGLADIIEQYQASAAWRINKLRDKPDAPVWHHQFHSRSLASLRELEEYRQYLRSNPSWLKL